MTTLILGVGFGTFIILTLWLTAGLICLISLRTQKKFGLTALSVTGLITIALLSIPRASENSDVSNETIVKSYDQLFIWRTLLLVLLAGSSLVAFFAYVKFEVITPVKAVRIKSWVI